MTGSKKAVQTVALAVVVAAAVTLGGLGGQPAQAKAKAKPPADLADANLVASLSPDGSQGVASVAFSPDGTTLAVLGNNGDTSLWDTRTGKWTVTLPAGGCHHTPAQVLYSPSGTTLAVISADSTCLWNVATRRQTAVLNSPRASQGAMSGAFSPNGQLLAIDDLDGSAYLWNVATRRLAATLNDPPGTLGPGAIDAVAFSPDGKTLVTGDQDNGTYFWDVATRRVTSSVSSSCPPGGVAGDPETGDSGYGVTTLATAADGTLAIGEGSAEACVWDLAARRFVAGFAPQIDPTKTNPCFYDFQADCEGTLQSGGDNGPLLTNVGLSPDGRFLAVSAYGAYGVAVWDVATRRQIMTATGTDAQGDSCEAPGPAVFSPDDRLMAFIGGGPPEYCSTPAEVWRVG